MSEADDETTGRAPRVHRTVVSYVRRSSRMRPYQRETWARLRDRYLVEVPRGELSTSVAAGAQLDLPAVFGREAPLVVEIGPGAGDSLVPMAATRQDRNVLAFEVYEPAIARLAAGAEAAGLDNVRIVQADAVQGVCELLTPDAITELWTFFPDPWPKPRHHKRRLIGEEFAELAAQRVRPGGLWRLATDWDDYAAVIESVIVANPAWAPIEAPSDRPITRFQRRGLEAGRRITELAYQRQARG